MCVTSVKLFILEQFELCLDTPLKEGQLHRIEVSYGGQAGLDLDVISKQLNLTTKELINLHKSTLYHVDFLGFLPGFSYLSGLHPSLQLPRRSEPRDRIAQNTLAIASTYCAIYPAISPGGWHLIGQADLALFKPENNPPALLQPSDSVQFVEV